MIPKRFVGSCNFTYIASHRLKSSDELQVFQELHSTRGVLAGDRARAFQLQVLLSTKKEGKRK